MSNRWWSQVWRGAGRRGWEERGDPREEGFVDIGRGPKSDEWKRAIFSHFFGTFPDTPPWPRLR